MLVSSHNQVLGPILAERYTPRHVAQDEAGGLVLRDGVLTKTNGISLLTTHGFDEGIEANALKVWHWLSQYLSKPDGEVRILAGPEAAARALS